MRRRLKVCEEKIRFERSHAARLRFLAGLESTDRPLQAVFRHERWRMYPNVLNQ